MEIVRLSVLRIPTVIFVSKFMGYHGIFWGIFISNIFTIVIAYIFFKSEPGKKY
jgi:Na+-driven multidrug efflux pump